MVQHIDGFPVLIYIADFNRMKNITPILLVGAWPKLLKFIRNHHYNSSHAKVTDLNQKCGHLWLVIQYLAPDNYYKTAEMVYMDWIYEII